MPRRRPYNTPNSRKLEPARVLGVTPGAISTTCRRHALCDLSLSSTPSTSRSSESLSTARVHPVRRPPPPRGPRIPFPTPPPTPSQKIPAKSVPVAPRRRRAGYGCQRPRGPMARAPRPPRRPSHPLPNLRGGPYRHGRGHRPLRPRLIRVEERRAPPPAFFVALPRPPRLRAGAAGRRRPPRASPPTRTGPPARLPRARAPLPSLKPSPPDSH